jgi:hypothetical protein
MSGAIEEVDDEEESVISELAELTKKTGMKPLAKKSDRFLSVGLSDAKKRPNNSASAMSQKKPKTADESPLLKKQDTS